MSQRVLPLRHPSHARVKLRVGRAPASGSPAGTATQMKTAVIQFNATDNKDENFKRALAFVESAAKKKAKFIVLPEIFIFRGNLKLTPNVAEMIPGPTIREFSQLAKKYRVFILAGSIYEKVVGQKKVYNTSVLIDNQGQVKAKYRKVNLFNVTLNQKRIVESERFLAGKQSVSTRVGEFSVGLTICYDLRFPKLFWDYGKKGVEVLCVPSAFTHETGKVHWETLLKARAIENFAYVLAPNQVGENHRGIKTYGHSMIIDPWGKILAQASENREEIIYADLDKKRIQEVRQWQVPSTNSGYPWKMYKGKKSKSQLPARLDKLVTR